ncbi:transposase [Paracraurococcus sp. LOR1-02]|uniref:Transposase n=1 Tax=Paracraurococcus lichenis TaxID=3064888 RepID=A0ABT9EDI4_9PROT|nr:transposase [Paracraurococcus sp. LOR1-02]MDO9714283.1 transposase [Paracraurococcus sp. LOR1-02]
MNQLQPAIRHYAGLDVSLDSTAIRVVDDTGAIVWRGNCPTEPKAIAETLARRAPGLVWAGLETGQLSNWLTLALRRLRVPVTCLDARHAKAALALKVNKTDANDALGLAQVVRTGWYREVAVKGMDAQALRMLLVARAQLISQRQDLANAVRGLLKPFGLAVAPGSKGPFEARVLAAVEGNGALLAIVEPLLAAWHALREQTAVLDGCINARQGGRCRPAADDNSRGRRRGGARLRGGDRRSGAVREIKRRRRLPRPCAEAPPIRQDGPHGRHLEVRRPAAEVLPLRSRERATDAASAPEPDHGLGSEVGGAHRPAAGEGGRQSSVPATSPYASAALRSAALAPRPSGPFCCMPC